MLTGALGSLGRPIFRTGIQGMSPCMSTFTFARAGGLFSRSRPVGRRAEMRRRPTAKSKSYDQSRVGDGDPERIVVPTNQVLSPLGRQVAYGGRPVDLALSPTAAGWPCSIAGRC